MMQSDLNSFCVNVDSVNMVLRDEDSIIDKIYEN